MSSGVDESKIQLLSFDEIFQRKQQTEKVLKKMATMKRSNSQSKHGGNELLNRLQKQRMHLDENAIHFVAEARGGKRADARNSVFKLAQRYKAMPDSERMQKIKQMCGDSVKENEDSGDEEWEPSYRRLPDVLKNKKKIDQILHEDASESLINEIDSIENESQKLSNDVVTKEEVPDAVLEKDLDACVIEKAKEWNELGKDNPNDDEDDDDVNFDDEDLRTLNTLQKEFMGNNLLEWYKDIQTAYASGVKLVKVNALGYMFIRIVQIKDMIMSIKQPHTKSQAKIDRQVAVTEIVDVLLGRPSKEFSALDNLVHEGKEKPENNPPATCCAVVALPNHRSLSLIFLKEENRNAFIFFLRYMVKKGKAAAAGT